MEKHIRELWDYLKDYGASNIHLDGGGKHQKLCFEYGGLERSYLVAHKPSTDHHAIENTKATLRRMLGPPVPAEEKQNRKLEELMADLYDATSVAYIGTPPITNPPALSKTWKVWMCGYHVERGTQLYFYSRHEIEQLFPDGVSVEQLDEEHWKLTNGGRSRFRKVYGRVKVSFTMQGIEPFGSTIAEAVEADGALLVYLPIEKRTKVQPHGQVKWPAQPTTKPVVAPALIVPTPAALTTPPPVRASVPVTLEEELRDIIQRVQAIEATCPYHLVRLEGGRIQWRAPIIE